jgi:hypothetical protein
LFKEGVNQTAKQIRCGVWVPAFAGTTWGYFQAETQSTFSSA